MSLRRTATLLFAATITQGAVAGALSAQDFEGVITIRTAVPTRDGAPSPEVEYMTRAGKLRLNVRSPMGTMGIIASPAEGKMYMLMDAQSMYMEQPLSLTPRAGAANAVTPEITRTGRKETIAGYECEHLLIAGDPGPTDVCVARGLGPYVPPAIGAAMPAWQRALAKDGAFPLKVSRHDGTVQLEVTKIEKRKLSPLLFTVPESYTRMDMPAGRRPPGARE